MTALQTLLDSRTADMNKLKERVEEVEAMLLGATEEKRELEARVEAEGRRADTAEAMCKDAQERIEEAREEAERANARTEAALAEAAAAAASRGRTSVRISP